MIRLLLSGFLALTLVMPAGCAGTKDARSSGKGDETIAEEKKEKKICREVMVTGSRIPRRVCKEPSQWWGKDQLEADSFMRRVRNQPAPTGK